MPTGKVKWFNNAKGYGFILPETGGEDLFAHYSSIQMDGYKTLKAGQSVEFELFQGPKGLHAVNIRTEAASSDSDTSSLDDSGQVASSSSPVAESHYQDPATPAARERAKAPGVTAGRPEYETS